MFRTRQLAAILSPHLTHRSIKTHPLFAHEQLADNVWRIEEKYFDSWNLANMYFIRGTSKDLLIDTGIIILGQAWGGGRGQGQFLLRSGGGAFLDAEISKKFQCCLALGGTVPSLSLAQFNTYLYGHRSGNPRFAFFFVMEQTKRISRQTILHRFDSYAFWPFWRSSPFRKRNFWKMKKKTCPSLSKEKYCNFYTSIFRYLNVKEYLFTNLNQTS